MVGLRPGTKERSRSKTRVPIATLSLIAMNVAVAIATLPFGIADGTAMFDLFGFIPRSPHPRAAISSLFVHADALHLTTNMAFLGFFASHVEQAIGSLKTLLLYLAGGIAAVLAHWGIAIAINSSVAAQPLIGASGAISAIIGYFTLRFYRSSFRMVLHSQWRLSNLWIPVWVAALVWIGLQSAGAISAILEHRMVVVGYWAHMGGFAFGVLVGALWRAGNVGEWEHLLEQADEALRLSNPASALNHLDRKSVV